MTYTTLVSIPDALAHLDDPHWVFVDCRFSLDDPQRGRRDYALSHIPGAIYAHLNDDLSAPVVPGVTGRHPLPSVEQLATCFSAWGIDSGVQVVAYDDWAPANGAAAARLWWCSRWLGHDSVAVMDGGWPEWIRRSAPLQSEVKARPARNFIPKMRSKLVVSADEVLDLRNDPAWRVFDSRTPDRYRGENETIDPVAGRIPGAYNAAYVENVGADGLFRSSEELKQRFSTLLAHVPAEQAIFYCGSGVSAAHNLLALQHAGLGEGRLYAGSWSEWITDPRRPVASG